MENKFTHISLTQEKYILQALANINKLIRYKLGFTYADSVEDLSQRIFYKIWSWSLKHGKNLNYEDWQKILNVTVRREIAEFFSEKYRRDILFSQVTNQTVLLSIESFHDQLEGNSETETNSLLLVIWKAMQKLNLRERYALVLYETNLLIEFIYGKYCTTQEIAEYFQLSKQETTDILRMLPLADERITKMLEKKINKEVSPKQLWEARSKAKSKLNKIVTNYLTR